MLKRVMHVVRGGNMRKDTEQNRKYEANRQKKKKKKDNQEVYLFKSGVISA